MSGNPIVPYWKQHPEYERSNDVTWCGVCQDTGFHLVDKASGNKLNKCCRCGSEFTGVENVND